MEEEKINTADPLSAENVASKDPEDQDYDDQGYEDLSNNESEDGEDGTINWGYSQKEIDITSELLGLRAELEEKIKTLGLSCYFTDGEVKKVILMGEGHLLQEFATYVNSVKKMTEKNNFQSLSLGPYTQKEVPLRSSFRHFKPLIDQVAEKLELVIEYDKTKLIVHGYERRIRDLMSFLFEKEAEYGEGQYIDQEINISTFHRVQKPQIEVKAVELGLESEFGYDMISVRGPRKLVDKLVLYLIELETMAKQSLFPYHWDFTDSKPLSLVDVYRNTAEFKLVEDPFMKGLPHAKILSIQRIQNKYLMDQFIMVINKRMEERPDEAINRKLLFHGTRENPPEKIYANFDTGFDLQYARYGSYGKGIYFANNSTYSDGYAFHSKEGTKKMFLADVFIGKASTGSSVNQVKAPQGYDSIEASGAGFYIVYHNFVSYPLYLIEYK